MSSTPNVYTCDAVTPTCLIQYSIYGYFPSLPANAFFLSLFIVLLVAQVYQGIRYKTWTFAFALCCGCFVEAFGYIGRLMLHHNPFSNNGFTMQICCLIMGPAWLAMGVYLTLKHVVKAFGPQYSYLKPKYYTWLFIGGDCVSLSLQAAGGGLSGGANGNTNQLNLGSNIAIAGIIMQVITLAIFAALAGLYFLRRHLAQRNGLSEKEGTPVTPQGQTMRFKLFAGAVIIAFLAISTRCVYRIAEMMGGWANPLMQDQTEFIALDSVMCSVAAVALTIFHPGYCFPQMAQPISFGQMKVAEHFRGQRTRRFGVPCLFFFLFRNRSRKIGHSKAGRVVLSIEHRPTCDSVWRFVAIANQPFYPMYMSNVSMHLFRHVSEHLKPK